MIAVKCGMSFGLEHVLSTPEEQMTFVTFDGIDNFDRNDRNGSTRILDED